MIDGNYWTKADLRITLETGINQTGLSGWARVAFPNGPVKEYAWTIKHFSKVQFLVPAADNIYPGELTIQAFSVISGETIPGDFEFVNVRDSLVATP
jgi:hypothetical protein